MKIVTARAVAKAIRKYELVQDLDGDFGIFTRRNDPNFKDKFARPSASPKIPGLRLLAPRSYVF